MRTMLAALGLAILPLVTAAAEPPAKGPYAPYAFLVGEWDIGAESGGKPFMVSRFRWGPGNSYLWYSNAFVANGAEQPHFEGLLLWNGVQRNLDVLIALDLEGGGRVAEKGTMSVGADGTVVRDILAYYSEGVGMLTRQRAAAAGGETVHFRQTFKALGPDRILTSLAWESESGWKPTFPGADHLVLTRRLRG